MTEKPLELKVGKIFFADQYVIPLYQRNYSWEEAQVTQLIQDVWDYALLNNNNYFIGTLVVHKRENNNSIVYETIDGQQRLTTLNILLSVLKNEFAITLDYPYESKLIFDSRKISSDTLKILSHNLPDKEKAHTNTKMEQAYCDMVKKMHQLINDGSLRVGAFSDYLFNRVAILRVEVPYDTDLNHYFEIMNNRGEQLEKHEILKAKLLNLINNDEESSEVVTLIWEACSDMERYMQFGFKRDLRDAIFLYENTWDNIPDDFDELKKIIKEQKVEKKVVEKRTERNFLKLLSSESRKFSDIEEEDIDENIRFNSIVNFSNFLLHALRIFKKSDIPLDDKRLIDTFDEVINKEKDKSNFVKEFSHCLFFTRFLFDNYIIKREYNQFGDGWSLKSIKLSKKKPYYSNSFDDELLNRQALMLTSMFHVSFTQMIYKHWLSGVLFYLYYTNYENLNAENYIEYLEELSDAFYFDKFCKDELDYFDIIFNNEAIAENKKIDENNLHLGTNVQNYIFNRLDYKIWKSIIINHEKEFKIDNIHKFEFSFRSSVEHYYPRNPKPGAILEPLNEDMLDKFGNLCLISRSKNSELSNYSPLAKAEHYSKSITVESLKQQLMMQHKDNWNKKTILEHQNVMIRLLNEKLAS
jgi:uncharacterized protein with ParB-like and HNH nuclease domain